MPPTHRSTPGIRRPRVAGRRTTRSAPAEALTSAGRRGGGRTATVEEATPEPAQVVSEPAADGRGEAEQAATVDEPLATERAEERTAGAEDVDEEAADASPARPRRSLRALRTTPVTTRALIAWGAAATVLVFLASFFGALWYHREHSGPAANRALIDIGATSQVAQQVADAVTTIYSYDFARLDENERTARAVITPEFEQQFGQLFTEVRARAPQQKAVVTATVSNTGVSRLEDDTAVVVLFMNQIATRAAEDGPQQLASAGRLTVTAKKIDGVWKIADVQAV
ncbi:hypothetical protein [Pseudonocardia thermophila]|uniref:hypothetical protein n=1 Tax=Pseudonocardia thermophila TaxID=1848 RepID=UPI00248DE76A|nr:hypothetical protein [Pseudonocardia thermophila]